MLRVLLKKVMVRSLSLLSRKISRWIFAEHSGSQTRSISSKINDEKSKDYTSLSCHWDTVPPSSIQLMKAAEFFRKSTTKFLWSKEKFRDMPFGHSFDEGPEVCLLGRSNVGKSSLLNALLCQRIAYTSSKPGRTKLLSAFAVHSTIPSDQKDKLIVLDVPGYGKGGRAEIGYQVIKYMEKRKQLKRVFLLVDTTHGVKNSDKQMLELCKQIGVPFQVLLSKVDKVITTSAITQQTSISDQLGKVIGQVKQAIGLDGQDIVPGIGEIIPFSSTKWMFGRRLGIDEVRFAILRAVGLEHKEMRRKFNPLEIITYDQLFPSETRENE